jgi:hypothetical protein
MERFRRKGDQLRVSINYKRGSAAFAIILWNAEFRMSNWAEIQWSPLQPEFRIEIIASAARSGYAVRSQLSHLQDSQ